MKKGFVGIRKDTATWEIGDGRSKVTFKLERGKLTAALAGYKSIEREFKQEGDRVNVVCTVTEKSVACEAGGVSAAMAPPFNAKEAFWSLNGEALLDGVLTTFTAR